jgi:uncharacterized protein (DUF58 family)
VTPPDPAPPPPRPRRERSFRVTRLGWYWLGLAALLVAIGVFKNVNLLALLGYFMLAAAGLNAAAAGRAAAGLRVRRRVPEPLFAGRPGPVVLEVANRGRRTRRGVRLEDAGPAHALQWFLPALGRGGAHTFRDQVVLAGRGRYAWGPVRGVSSYPFGLAQRGVRLAPGEDVIVLPRLGSLHRGRLRRRLRGVDPGTDRVRRQPRAHPAAQAEIYGLRPFRPGDSPRAIHWRTTARRGELMVREFEDVPADALILVFDPAAAGVAPEAFEAAVSLAATVAHAWCVRSGDRLVLAVGGPEPVVLDGLAGPAHARRVLEALALAAPAAPGAPDDGALLGRLAGFRDVAASALLVGTGPARLAEAARGALRRPVTYLDGSAPAGLDFYEPPRPALGREAP